jgi:uroporphyrin-III C-methyltransferase
MSVAIVGAGPGDPKLITVRGLELVRGSEILVYDRLVSLELVGEARQAALIERDGLGQAEVNELLVRHGRRGRAVVRLKGGDPFVFGRGAEEVEALASAGIPYEVVPGLSTLTVLPALAGIPLTSRGVSSQVTALTATSADGSDLDFDRLAATPGTIVLFMGLGRIEQIADGLILAGRPVDEPVAVVSRLSLPDGAVHSATLGTIAAVARTAQTPAVIVIGDVVDHASLLGSGSETSRNGRL